MEKHGHHNPQGCGMLSGLDPRDLPTKKTLGRVQRNEKLVGDEGGLVSPAANSLVKVGVTDC